MEKTKNMTVEQELSKALNEALDDLDEAVADSIMSGETQKVYWAAKRFIAVYDARGILKKCYPPIPPDAEKILDEINLLIDERKRIMPDSETYSDWLDDLYNVGYKIDKL